MKFAETPPLVAKRAVVLDRFHAGDARQFLGEVGAEAAAVVFRMQKSVDVVEDVFPPDSLGRVGFAKRLDSVIGNRIDSPIVRRACRKSGTADLSESSFWYIHTMESIDPFLWCPEAPGNASIIRTENPDLPPLPVTAITRLGSFGVWKIRWQLGELCH